jgi:hypothetical protein
MSITPSVRWLAHLATSAAALLLAASFVNPVAAWGGKSVTGSGKLVEDVRLVSGYTKVELKGAMDVEVRQSGKEGVTIMADDNIAPLIRATVSGKTLVIDSNASWSTRIKMRVIVDTIALSGISVSGSGDVRAPNLKSPELEVGISGSGDVALEGLNTETLKVKISGSGDLRASGSAKSQTYSIAGSGDIRAEGLEGAHVKVSIAGSGDARVWSKESLEAVIMGSGDIRHKGKPASVNKRVLGSGDVSEL